jgi:hypothetical protein
VHPVYPLSRGVLDVVLPMAKSRQAQA